MTQKDYFRDSRSAIKAGTAYSAIALGIAFALAWGIQRYPEHGVFSEENHTVMPTDGQIMIGLEIINALFSLWSFQDSYRKGVDWNADFQTFHNDPDRWKKLAATELAQLTFHIMFNPLCKKLERKIYPSESKSSKLRKEFQFTQEAINQGRFSLKTARDYVDLIISGTLFTPITEELLFRGFETQQMAKRFPKADPKTVNWIQAFSFGILHGGKAWPFATVTGYLFSRLDQSNEDNLWYSIICHWANNTFCSVALFVWHELKVHSKRSRVIRR